MDSKPACDPISIFCYEAVRLVSEHELVCRSNRPPRAREWKDVATAHERERRVGEFLKLAAPAITRGCASDLPSAEVESRIKRLANAVDSFLCWLPPRCSFGLGQGNSHQDGPDIEADPEHWKHADAARWRKEDDQALAGILADLRHATEQCETMAALAAGRDALNERDAHTRARSSPESEQPCTTFTETQRSILSLLDGRAMSGKELANEIGCDLSRLQRDHLKPLMTAGRVLNSKAVGGYYRPDKPPQ